MNSPISTSYTSSSSSSASSWSVVSPESDMSDQMQQDQELEKQLQQQQQQQRFINLPLSSCSPCPEELLSLAAETVLSVLQCPPSTTMFRSSSLICKSPLTLSTTTTTELSSTSTMTEVEKEQHVLLQNFLRNVCYKAAVTELALVVSLIYVDRLKKVLTNMARGDPDTPFKIILSALLVVKKFIEEDCIGLNRMFSKITDGLYSVHDINIMERSFLGLLKFSLYVTEKDVIDFIQSHQKELQGVDIIKTLKNSAVAA